MGLFDRLAGFLARNEGCEPDRDGSDQKPSDLRSSGGASFLPPNVRYRPRRLDDIRERAIWLRRAPGHATLSRLGGLPSLPRNVAWPVNPQTGFALHFLAQIDLATLPATPLDKPSGPALPPSGMLFFFADMEEEMLWGDRGENDLTRVIFAEAAGPERQPPPNLPLIGHSYEEMRGTYAHNKTHFASVPVRAHVIDTFPGVELYFQGEASEEADRRTLQSIERALGEPVPVLQGLRSTPDELQHPAVVSQLPGYLGGEPREEISINRHQMLGAATSVQGTADAMHEQGNILLLQIDSDFAVDEDFMFCDMGMAQFWITPQDLRAGRFDRAWGTTEGG